MMSSLINRRLSRRQAIKGGVIAGLGLSLLPACGSGKQAAPAASTTPTVKRGGALNIVGTFDVKGFDPYVGADEVKDYICDLTYERLVKWQPSLTDRKMVGGLAESWEQPDARTYVFKLRKGVKWHNLPPVNGRELDSEDVNLSFQRIATPDPKFQRRWMFEEVERIETPDKYTVKIVLKKPVAPFIEYLAERNIVIMAKEVMAAVAAKDEVQVVIGTGPFYQEKYERNIGGVYPKHPNYWREGFPYLDRVNLRIVPETATRTAAFRTGELDIMRESKATADAIKRTNPNVAIQKIPGTNPDAVGNTMFRLRCDKPPFKDPKVRKAVAMALDYDKIIKAVFDGEGTRTSHLPPWYADDWGAPKVDQLIKQDIAKAKQLLAEAGYPNGFKTSMLGSAGRLGWKEIPLVASEQLKAVGIDMAPEVIEHGTYASRMYAVDFEMNIGVSLTFAYDARTGHAFNGFRDAYHSQGGRNFTKYGNPKLDPIIDELGGTIDKAKAKKLATDIQAILHEDYPEIPVAIAYGFSLAQPWVKGFQASLTSVYDWLAEAWLDK